MGRVGGRATIVRYRGMLGIMANIQSEVVDVEEVMPTLEDQQMVSRWMEAKWKSRQMLRSPPGNDV